MDCFWWITGILGSVLTWIWLLAANVPVWSWRGVGVWSREQCASEVAPSFDPAFDASQNPQLCSFFYFLTWLGLFLVRWMIFLSLNMLLIYSMSRARLKAIGYKWWGHRWIKSMTYHEGTLRLAVRNLRMRQSQLWILPHLFYIQRDIIKLISLHGL